MAYLAALVFRALGSGLHPIVDAFSNKVWRNVKCVSNNHWRVGASLK